MSNPTSEEPAARSAHYQRVLDHHASVNRLLRYFEFEHLPPHLQALSKPFHDLAHAMNQGLPGYGEVEAGLRKLLEAKDCLVRAALD